MMHFKSRLSILLTGAAVVSTLLSCTRTQENSQPNIIYILMDDMGYGEAGAYGQKKIKTPNIDALAQSGMRFTQHYSGSPVCAPSRCVLLTGQHSGHAYIRGNDPMAERGDVWNFEKASHNPNLEGQRPIPANTVTVGKLLQQAGYTTSCIGKWGLGGPLTDGHPNKQGFDHFFGFICQRQAHSYYPLHLWRNHDKVQLNNDLVVPNTKLDDGADPRDVASYQKFTGGDYTPDLMFEEAQTFIASNKEHPFFLYFSTPIPHLPLSVPQEWIDKYVAEFGDEAPYTGARGYFPARHPKATYAAMITYLDHQIGQMVQQLKDEGLYENTIILFSSDNGATFTGGSDTPWFKSNAPFKSEYGYGKGFLHEGGIRVPMIASWPGQIEPGTSSGHVSAFQDVLPTLCDIAGVKKKVRTDGISFLPTLLEKEQPTHDYLYFEFAEYGGQQAVRIGDWKGIRKNIHKGNLIIELYDLATDIQELNNIADQHPEIVKQMEEIMQKEHVPSAVKRFKFATLGDE